MLDPTDLEIIELLKTNGRMQWRDIGERVHLTGQAVANRIQRLENLGAIKGYCVVLDQSLIGKPILSFITVYMKTTDHLSFQKFIAENNDITEANRISGEGCYLLKAYSSSHEDLNSLLNSILKYGNYKINMSIGKIK